jgi:polyene macrolide polyketide synthase
VLSVARELSGAADAALDAETPLMEVGVDSLAATELSSRLRSLTGVALSPTLVFEHPTARAVAAHLIELAAGWAAAVAPRVPAAAVVAAAPLALSGLVGRWPGGCDGEVARWRTRRRRRLFAASSRSSRQR